MASSSIIEASGRCPRFGFGLAFVALAACVEAPGNVAWPDPSGLSLRILATRDGSGLVRLLRAREEVTAALVLDDEAQVLLLDYECADAEALGFRPLGGDGFEVPSGPVRSPDRLFVLERAGEMSFRPGQASKAEPSLLDLGFDFRFPSLCRLFEPVLLPLRISPPERTRFLLPLPDQSLLFMTANPEDDDRPIAYRVRAPGDFDRIELPQDAPAHAGAVDANGRLWLHGRSGVVAYGDPDDLTDFDARFQRLPDAAASHSCEDAPSRRVSNDSFLAVRTETGTTARLLVVDGNGTLQLFRDGRWTTLHDPVSMGQPGFLCRVAPLEALWLAPNEALIINRSIAIAPLVLQVVRLTLDAEGTATFSDDGIPTRFEGAGRLLDLGDRGIYVGGGRGSLARRRGGQWTRLEVSFPLTRDTAALFAGPGGSLLAGNNAEGVAQFWPDAEGGPVTCLTAATNSLLRDAGRLGEQHVMAMPSNDGDSLSALFWDFRGAEVCEAHPN